MDWHGLFDLPGALDVERYLENAHLFHLLSEKLVLDGSHLRFAKLLEEHVVRAEAKDDERQSEADRQPAPEHPFGGAWPEESAGLGSPLPPLPPQPPSAAEVKPPAADCTDPRAWAAYKRRCADRAHEEEVMGFLNRAAKQAGKQARVGSRPPAVGQPDPQRSPAPAGEPSPLRSSPSPLMAALGIPAEPGLSEAQIRQAQQLARKEVQAAADSFDLKEPGPAPVFVAAPLQQAA